LNWPWGEILKRTSTVTLLAAALSFGTGAGVDAATDVLPWTDPIVAGEYSAGIGGGGAGLIEVLVIAIGRRRRLSEANRERDRAAESEAEDDVIDQIEALLRQDGLVGHALLFRSVVSTLRLRAPWLVGDFLVESETIVLTLWRPGDDDARRERLTQLDSVLDQWVAEARDVQRTAAPPGRLSR